jgi:hypothetical protein
MMLIGLPRTQYLMLSRSIIFLVSLYLDVSVQCHLMAKLRGLSDLFSWLMDAALKMRVLVILIPLKEIVGDSVF